MGVALVVSALPWPGAQAAPAGEPGAEVPSETATFPLGDVFRPLLADPKQPRLFLSLREYDTPSERLTGATVGFGETYGLYRFRGRVAGDGMQLGIDGGLVAWFNLEVPSRELVNADYNIGIPITWRQGDRSARLRLYHQSSHLGDGYLQRVRPQRVLLYHESVALLFAQQWQGWRAYVGGEYLYHREPDALKPAVLQAGVEYYGPRLWDGARLLAGVDFKSPQQHAYAVDTSLQLGIEAGGREPGERRLRLVLEGFGGHSPHGQFFLTDRISYYGIGLYLGL